MATSVNDVKEWEEYEKSWENKTKSILLKDAKIKDRADIPMVFSQLPF